MVEMSMSADRRHVLKNEPCNEMQEQHSRRGACGGRWDIACSGLYDMVRWACEGPAWRRRNNDGALETCGSGQRLVHFCDSLERLRGADCHVWAAPRTREPWRGECGGRWELTRLLERVTTTSLQWRHVQVNMPDKALRRHSALDDRAMVTSPSTRLLDNARNTAGWWLRTGLRGEMLISWWS